MHEPLAALLGAFEDEGDVIEYGFSDVVALSGHACPTVSSAFVACKYAMRALFPDDGIGRRGEISIVVHGERDDGVFGVMASVFSFVTGACAETGFKGIGGLYRRNNLLTFGKKQDDSCMRFDFAKCESNARCRIVITPSALPSLGADQAKRMNLLLEKNVWQGANASERAEFRDLWMQRVRAIALEERDLSTWLTIERTGP